MENQEIMENRQNYNSMQHMNVNIASAGCDAVVGGDVQEEVVSGGVAGEFLVDKYDERHEKHDVDDDEELKYVEELQQSEKQQQQQLQALKNFGLDDNGAYESNELAEIETTKNVPYEFGNGDGGFVFGGDHQFEQKKQEHQHHDLFKIGNGHDTNGHGNVNVNDDYSNIVSVGFEQKLNMMESEMDGFKTDGDFSSIRDVTESVEDFIPQIDVQIETKPEPQEMVDEEEPSSLATNTTNGTSSLSDNVPPQAIVLPQAAAFDNFMSNLEDKENSEVLTPQRPQELDLEQGHSQLNPDAKEFVPTFGSNPASPTSPFATGTQLNDETMFTVAMDTEMCFGHPPSAVPRALLIDDDFVAHSPRKGRGDDNMDTVSLPQMSEFEQEIKKRPHEVEPEDVGDYQQRDEVMTPDQAIQQLPLDDLTAQEKENQPPLVSNDFYPSNLTDHGPETSVDFDLQPSVVMPSLQEDDDVMKRSMYVASDDAIEDVLNSVQPIPTEIDSINNSFIEESATESAANQLAGDKELFQVEEKEHVSHSPSTEEIQMNLQNTLNSSNKDIPQIPIDLDNLDNANNMQESLYMEQDQRKEQGKEFNSEPYLEDEQQLQTEAHTLQLDSNRDQENEEVEEQDFKVECQQENLEQSYEEAHFKQENHDESYQDQIPRDLMDDTHSALAVNESILAGAPNLLLSNDSFIDNSSASHELEQEIQESFSPFKVTDEVLAGSINITSSPTADAKHLLEETKEQQIFSMSALGQQMNEMILNSSDDHFSQIHDVVATTATTVIDYISENLISNNEAVNHDQSYYGELHEAQEQTFVDDSFQRHEQECLQQEYEQKVEQENEIKVEQDPAVVAESIESLIEQQNQQQLDCEMMMPVEEPIVEAKQTSSLFTNAETDIVTKTEESEEKQENKPATSMELDTTPVDLLEESRLLTQNETEREIEHEMAKEVNDSTLNADKSIEKEFTKSELVEMTEAKTDTKIEAVPATAVAATAAAAAVVSAKTVDSPKTKTETTKKPLGKTAAPAAKPKVSAATSGKKPADVSKKPVAAAAKPRTAPAKPIAAAAEKKPIAKSSTTTTTTTARKPLSATTSTASKVVAKTTSTTTSVRATSATSKTATTSRPTTAARTVSASTTTVRKTAAASATANGTAARPRPTTAPAKPTTLGLSATNGAAKPKPTSPRATLTSQIRKSLPATTAAKSPLKSTASSVVTKTATTTLASKTKTTTSTASSTTGKTFTARPAPKFTSSSSTTTTTTTTRRLAAGGSTAASTTTTTTKTSSAPLRKSSPAKQATARTPIKSSTTAGGLRSKPSTPSAKPDTPPVKPAPIRKPVDKTAVAINGENNVSKELNGTGEKINAEEIKQQGIISENILNLQAVQHNGGGDFNIPIETEKHEQQQQSSLEARDEQIPMDLINA